MQEKGLTETFSLIFKARNPCIKLNSPSTLFSLVKWLILFKNPSCGLEISISSGRSDKPRRAAVLNYFQDGVCSDTDEPLLKDITIPKVMDKP